MKDRIAIAVFALIFSAAMIGTASAEGVSFTAKFGVDAMGQTEMDLGDYGGDTETGDAKMGFSLAIEGLYNMESFQLGLGVSYLIPRGIDEDWPDGKFSALPIYAVLNVPFRGGDLTPFIAVQLGYSLLMMDSTMTGWFEDNSPVPNTEVSVKGGLYWAIGGGIIFNNNVQVELLYRSHSGKMEAESDTDSASIDVSITHVTLSIGYRF
ncbi:MAG: outer membrane beta-barrel protein [Spirochaetes bacterium]|nr:outer membrane beta-barrel protein [Spirochaetota bacterium]